MSNVVPAATCPPGTSLSTRGRRKSSSVSQGASGFSATGSSLTHHDSLSAYPSLPAVCGVHTGNVATRAASGPLTVRDTNTRRPRKARPSRSMRRSRSRATAKSKHSVQDVQARGLKVHTSSIGAGDALFPSLPPIGAGRVRSGKKSKSLTTTRRSTAFGSTLPPINAQLKHADGASQKENFSNLSISVVSASGDTVLLLQQVSALEGKLSAMEEAVIAAKGREESLQVRGIACT